jgi:mannose-1-phosphate guanylyltransferase
MKLTAVIMAGGRGERFWPRSRTAKPKQFLSLTADKETMLQKTVNRLKPLLEMDAIYVVTNQRYAALVQEQLPELPAENILPEPCSRNTAPCIGLAAAVIQKRCGEAMMLVLPSDHLIRYESLYVDTLRQAIAVAEQGERLVTIGSSMIAAGGSAVCTVVVLLAVTVCFAAEAVVCKVVCVFVVV